MIFAVDTNVLLDVLYKDEDFHKVSRRTLEQKSERGYFIISPEVYSELASSFAMRFDEGFKSELDNFLEEKNIILQNHSEQSLKKAGSSWKEYSSSDAVECPECGVKNSFKCEKCGSKVTWRNHLITDFMIGAHAEEKADALITRDEGYFGRYFDVEVIDPSNN